MINNNNCNRMTVQFLKEKKIRPLDMVWTPDYGVQKSAFAVNKIQEKKSKNCVSSITFTTECHMSLLTKIGVVAFRRRHIERLSVVTVRCDVHRAHIYLCIAALRSDCCFFHVLWRSRSRACKHNMV